MLEPQLPKDILLNPDIPDDEALALPHQIRVCGYRDMCRRRLWVVVSHSGKHSTFIELISADGGQFFYWNMRRLGRGLMSYPYASIPWVVATNISGTIQSMISSIGEMIRELLPPSLARPRTDLRTY
jgi:hypothetical protein